MEKYIVICHSKDGDIEIEVEGKQYIDGDGYLRFGRDNFVFARGSWSYFKKVTE